MTHGECNVKKKKKSTVFSSRYEVLLPAEKGKVQPVTCYARNGGV
jgi:hypothetical protein